LIEIDLVRNLVIQQHGPQAIVEDAKRRAEMLEGMTSTAQRCGRIANTHYKMFTV
jgi:hypothetical protein